MAKLLFSEAKLLVSGAKLLFSGAKLLVSGAKLLVSVAKLLVFGPSWAQALMGPGLYGLGMGAGPYGPRPLRARALWAQALMGPGLYGSKPLMGPGPHVPSPFNALYWPRPLMDLAHKKLLARTNHHEGWGYGESPWISRMRNPMGTCP